MAVELAKAYVTLVPSFTGAQGAIAKGLGDLGGAGGKGGRALGAGILGGFRSAIGPIAGIAAAAFGVKAIVNFGKAGVDALSRIETINAQTASAIKATGGAANVSADHVFNLSRKLEGLTASEAESIQEGANLLLTFKNVHNEAGKGNDIFDQSTAVMVDMARAMGTDVAGGAVQLGKALNDPIAGISALSRVGVTFSDKQKDMIKTLVESGDVMGAQKIILKELNSEFGGAGAAYAATYAGKIDMLKDAFGGVQEKIVAGLMPALGKIAGAATGALSSFAESPLFGVISDKLAAIGDGVAKKFEGAAKVFEDMGKSEGTVTFGAFLDKLSENSPALAALTTIFQAMAPVMPQIADALAKIGPDLTDLFVAIAPLLPGAARDLTTIIDGLAHFVTDVMPFLTNWDDPTKQWADAIKNFHNTTHEGFQTWATDVMFTIATWVNDSAAGFYGWANDTAAGFYGWTNDTAAGFYGWTNDTAAGFYGWANDTAAGFYGWTGGVAAAIGGWVSQTAGAIGGWVGSTAGQFAGWVGTTAGAIGGWVGRTAGQFAGWVSQTAGQFAGWASRVAGGFAAWVSQTAGQVAGWASRVIGAIANFVSTGISRITSFWSSAGAAFSSGVTRAVGFVAALPGRALSALGNVGGILVSSGRALVQGFVNGILGMIGAVANAVNSVVQAARNFFPNSPAKTGPFSGSGWRKLKESGGAIMDQFESGLRPVVVPLSASVGMAGFGSSRVYAPAPAGGYGAAPTVNMTVNNPVNEPTSETSRRASQLIGAALAV